MGFIGSFFSGMSQGASAGMGYSMSQHFIENRQEKKEQKRFAEEAKEYGMTPEQYKQWLAQQQQVQQMPQGYPPQQLPPSYPPQYTQPYPQQQYAQPYPHQPYQFPMPMQDGVYVLAPGQGTRHISGSRMKDAISQAYNLPVTDYYEIEDSPECLTHVCMSRNTTDCPIVALPMNIAQIAFGMDDGYDVNYYYCPDCGELVMDRTTYR
jgi:hypothetical protein